MARIVLGGALLTLAFLFAGFLMFAAAVTRDDAPKPVKADGVVALTGGSYRIRRAAQLLAEGQARRLLITGVNRKTSLEQLLALTGLREDKFRCCVDVGYRALNTRGNADETLGWIRRHGFKSLIIVTANYHMPRSVAEFRRRFPDVQLYPHPVKPFTLRKGPWWLDGERIGLLATEYLKYLSASALSWMSASLQEARDMDPVPDPRPAPDGPPYPTITLSAG